LPPFFALVFILSTLNYLSRIEQQLSSRFFPVKIKTTPQLQQTLDAFISSYHQALLSNDANNLKPFYAPQVDYYQLGKISHQIVVEEKYHYFKRWKYVEQKLLETPEVFETSRSNEIFITYLFEFRAEKKSNSSPLTVSGKGRQRWRLQETSHRFVIIEENQQLFYRHYD